MLVLALILALALALALELELELERNASSFDAVSLTHWVQFRPLATDRHLPITVATALADTSRVHEYLLTECVAAAAAAADGCGVGVGVGVVGAGVV